MASFRKRPNGKFQAKVLIGKDTNGKSLYKYITKTTLKECKIAAFEIEHNARGGIPHGQY